MEIKLSKIQETLEKSRKVLMESMEIRPNTNKSSFLDRINYPRFGSIKKPETDHIYLSHQTDTEKSLFSHSPNHLPYEFSLMDPQKLEIERQKIHFENEILMKKLTKPQERFFGVEKSSNVSRNLTPTPGKYNKAPEVVSYQKYNENSFDHLKYLREKIEEVDQSKVKIKENDKSVTQKKENSKSSVKKYKRLVETLEKQLRTVTKKYEELKKGDTHSSNRNISTGRPRNSIKSKKSGKNKVKRDNSCVSYRS